MAKKLYVGNMSYGTSEETLRNLFAQYGEVASVNLITDRYTGESKGFGFVEMASDAEADAAISALNGRELEGRKLRVDVAQERQRSGGRDRPFRPGRRRALRVLTRSVSTSAYWGATAPQHVLVLSSGRRSRRQRSRTAFRATVRNAVFILRAS